HEVVVYIRVEINGGEVAFTQSNGDGRSRTVGHPPEFRGGQHLRQQPDPWSRVMRPGSSHLGDEVCCGPGQVAIAVLAVDARCGSEEVKPVAGKPSAGSAGRDVRRGAPMDLGVARVA